MKIRLILQPIAAILLAIRAGVHDTRASRPLYFWLICTDRVHLRDILRDGWKDVGRVFVIAVVIDFIYQVIVFQWDGLVSSHHLTRPGSHGDRFCTLRRWRLRSVVGRVQGIQNRAGNEKPVAPTSRFLVTRKDH